MKKSLIIAISALLGLGACDTMTTNLEGKWQLNQIESEGNVATVDTIWYNFQTTLFQYQIYDRSSDSYRYSYGYNFYEGDQLTLQLLSDPRPVQEFLPYTDWTEATRDFTVEKVSNTQLILSSEGKRYVFKKY